MIKYFHCLISLIFLSLTLTAQERVEGVLLDFYTKAPIAFSNICFTDKTGTISNEKGLFSLPTHENEKYITIYKRGYFTIQYPINKLQDAKEIYMIAESTSNKEQQQEEINILEIKDHLKKVQINAPKKSTPYKALNYEKLKVFKQNNAIHPYSNEDHFLFIETVKEQEHASTKSHQEKILYTNISGFKQPSLSFLPSMVQNHTCYDSYIKVLNLEIASPISQKGAIHYSYHVNDTIINELKDTILYISYQPKEESKIEMLKGVFHLNITKNKIESISGKTEDKRTFSFSFSEGYQNSASPTIPSYQESIITYNNGYEPPTIIQSTNYLISVKTIAKKKRKKYSNITLSSVDAIQNSDSILKYRAIPLSSNEQAAIIRLNNLGENLKAHQWAYLFKNFKNGYIPMGVINLDFKKFIDYTKNEGVKFGVGGWSNERISKKISIGGYYTYGANDEKYKYGYGAKLNLHKKSLTNVNYFFKRDKQAIGQTLFIDGRQYHSESFQTLFSSYMSFTEEHSITLSSTVKKFFQSQFSYSKAEVTPYSIFPFQSNTSTNHPYSIEKQSMNVKWHQNETFYDTYFGRFSRGSSWPKIWFNFTNANATDQIKTYYFQKYESQFQYSFKPTLASNFTCRINTGYIKGALPTPELFSAQGNNNGFSLEVPFTFETMRPNEFASHQYAHLFIRHHFPLTTTRSHKFKPEAIIISSAGFGKSNNASISDYPKGFYESGIYFKNLYKILFFNYGISFHYRYGSYSNNKTMDNIAIKLGFEFELK